MKTTKPKGGTDELCSQLEAYRDCVRSHQDINWRQKLGNWPAYAAVAGSALAMASNASANSIVYSGAQDITAGPIASAPAFSSVFRSQALKGFTIDHQNFAINVFQARSTSARPLSAEAEFDGFWFIDGARIASGGAISTTARARFGGGNFLDLSNSFAPGQPGFAGIKFASTIHSTDYHYGWVRLEYLTSANGLPDEIEAIDWAYNSIVGAPILAGQTSNSSSTTPEPSTSAMALLAAGSAGVLALRRRRAISKK